MSCDVDDDDSEARTYFRIKVKAVDRGPPFHHDEAPKFEKESKNTVLHNFGRKP